MRVRWTKHSQSHHRFAVTRDNGSVQSAMLNTRSFLLHDLVHLAVESEAGLTDGFFGLLAAGRDFAEINDRESPPSEPGLMVAEAVVGPMQALFNGRALRGLVLEHLGSSPLVTDAPVFVDDVLEQLRRLMGHWKATPYGASMERTWPLEPIRAGEPNAKR